jgi:hypothetical protein
VLLLVLVLVLIAFGLLVVALLSGSALWAWVSVAVSVVAAGVLLVDWLQRRAAVRNADRQQVAQAAPPEWSGFDADPVTEQIPVIRPEAVAPAEDIAAAETVVVAPVDRPPVSPQPPSGAPPWLPQSRESKSQRVVGSGVNTSGESPPVPVWAAGVDTADATGRANGVTPAEPPTQAHQAVPVEAGDFDVDVEDTTEVEPAVDAPDSTPAGAEDDAPSSATDSSTRSAAGSEADDAGEAAATDEAAAADEAAATDEEPAATAITKPEAPAADEAKVAKAPTGAVSATAASAEDKSEKTAGPATAGPATAAAKEKSSGSDKPDRTAEQTVVFPVSADTEPPEEPRDPGNAALVAELTDVVVVIDERPRYHVSGCRFLPGKTEIPLPVQEAVELGFTPCGWCNPDRTLSNKHRATSSR